MTNLVAIPAWDDIPQLEKTTRALGGAGGPMNLQAQALANRLDWLRLQCVNVRDPQYGAKGDGLTDDYVAITTADAVAAATGKILFFPAGIYASSKTLVAKSAWTGENTENKWAADSRGTIIVTMGAGNPARWTDIDGNDAETFTPLVVFGRSDASMCDMTIKCGGTRWSAGVFVPSTKRNRLVNVDIVGQWKERGLYIDATWSSTNLTLTALHPEIESDTAVTEFSARDCFFEGRWGAAVIGTTRSSGNWVWAPGGVSDMAFDNCRFGTSGVTAELLADGGGFYASAKVAAATSAQGINFVNCSFRVGAKYTFRADWMNRITFVNTYAETLSTWTAAGNAAALFSKTVNTGEIARVNDRHNADIDAAGTTVTNGIAFYKDTGIVTYRTDGRIFSPNYEGLGKATGYANRVTSYFNTAGVEGRNDFYYDDNAGAQTLIARLDKAGLSLPTGGLALNGSDRLSNYTIGTWTPVLAGSTTAGTNTYTVQGGRYVRIGNLVHVSGAITLSAIDATMAGTIQITGLPFTIKNDPGAWTGVSFARVLSTALTAGAQLVGQGAGNSTVINLIERSNTGDTNISASTKLSATFQARFSLTYEV